MTTGYPSAATENAVQANIVAAGYAPYSGSSSGTTGQIVAGDNSSVCVDNNNGSTANGTQLDLWTCNGGANQQWHLP